MLNRKKREKSDCLRKQPTREKSVLVRFFVLFNVLHRIAGVSDVAVVHVKACAEKPIPDSIRTHSVKIY